MLNKVKDVMNTQIKNIPADATVFEAIEKMVEGRIRSLLVLPCKKGDYGIITVRDIIFKVMAKKLDPRKVKVYEIASTPVITVEKETPIETVLSLMEQHNIARVFVKEEHKIIGVVSFFDILTTQLISLAKGSYGV